MEEDDGAHEDSVPPLIDTPPPDDTSEVHISFNALSGSGTHTSDTLYLFGSVDHSRVTMLVDRGSTHNFVQTRTAKFLGLHTTEAQPLKVTVGDDTVLACKHLCPNVAVEIQGHTFEVDLHVLPISGADIVLGIQWLKTLGPIITDYEALTMQFASKGQLVELWADAPTQPMNVSTQEIKNLLQTQAASSLFQLHISPGPFPSTHTPTTSSSPFPLTPTPNTSSPPTSKTDPPASFFSHPDPDISSLLIHYRALFNPPSTLPPPRQITHKIHLLPNSTPVNVRPYRYPHFQKCEIEKQVEEMLKSGLIQLSQSPFSSPVLLVKKKDDTWRFCVDYRALNAITVKDRFPMPTIDELLDELGNATWFSKLDLRQGFHQILMDPADITKTAFRTH